MGALKAYSKELNCNDLIAWWLTDLLSGWSGVVLGENPGDLFSVSAVASLCITCRKQEQTKNKRLCLHICSLSLCICKCTCAYHQLSYRQCIKLQNGWFIKPELFILLLLTGDPAKQFLKFCIVRIHWSARVWPYRKHCRARWVWML